MVTRILLRKTARSVCVGYAHTLCVYALFRVWYYIYEKYAFVSYVLFIYTYNIIESYTHTHKRIFTQIYVYTYAHTTRRPILYYFQHVCVCACVYSSIIFECVAHVSCYAVHTRIFFFFLFFSTDTHYIKAQHVRCEFAHVSPLPRRPSSKLRGDETNRTRTRRGCLVAVLFARHRSQYCTLLFFYRHNP